MVQVLMDASRIGGTIQTEHSGVVVCDEDGLVTVDSKDIPSLASAGAAFPLLTPQDMAKKMEERAVARAKRDEEIAKEIAKSEEERLKREGIEPESKDEEHPRAAAPARQTGPGRG